MRVYLLRHAEAVNRGTPGYPRDAERPLTDAGHEQARQVAAGLQQLKLELDVIVTSPYVRAAQTAEHVARVFGIRVPIREFEWLRPDIAPADASRNLKVLAAHQGVLCVGHEPHLSGWVAELCAGSGGMRCLMKKAGAACIEIETVPPRQGSGTLRWLLTPKQLTLIGRSS